MPMPADPLLFQKMQRTHLTTSMRRRDVILVINQDGTFVVLDDNNIFIAILC